MEQIIALLNYGIVLFFGVKLSIDFSGVEKNRDRQIATAVLFAVLLLVQVSCGLLLGFQPTAKLYPFIVHIPISLFLMVRFRRDWLTAVVSVCSAYLCCQIPRWFAMLALGIFKLRIFGLLAYMVCVFPTLYLLERYAVFPANQIIRQGKIPRLLFGAMPFLYYVFDYATTVYTDLLQKGSAVAVQFMPSTVSLLYFVFITVYYTEQQRRSSAESQAVLMQQQLKESERQISSLRATQEQTVLYRHDMRHHFALISGFAAEGELQKIKDYLAGAESAMNEITPVRYCENETVNLILSFFNDQAKKSGVVLCANVMLPAMLAVNDTELCALLSNALENAICAASMVADAPMRKVYIRALVNDGKLVISTENAFSGTLAWQNGLPRSKNSEAGHGFGMKSMIAIVERHGGLYSIDAAGGLFSLQLMLPLEQQHAPAVRQTVALV